MKKATKEQGNFLKLLTVFGFLNKEIKHEKKTNIRTKKILKPLVIK